MDEITSVNNSKIKEIAKLQQKKYREESNLFIVEGKKALDEIISCNIDIEQIFILKDSKISIKSFENKVILVNDAVMKKLSSTESVPEVITLAVKPKFDISKLQNFKRIALFENIKDAGNLGTIIRSAAAFGIDAILLTGDTVDIYNPKAIRSSAGNFFKLPIVKVDTKELKAKFLWHKFITTGLKNKQNTSIEELKQLSKYIILFGSEAEGLSNDLLELSDGNLLLDMNKNVESINLAVASSIIFYEIFKTF